MDEDCGYDVLEELEELDEVAVPQVDNRDTAPMDVPFRASTHSDWPPEPPLPADVDLAVGTLTEGVPPPRTARIFAAVRRPTTSSDTNDDGD
jgi:hypothetical protein